MGYREVYEGWKADPEGFWMEAAKAVDWVTPPSRALDASRAPFYGWFADGTCNTCWNAVDRHVEAGHGDRTAIIHDSPITDSKSSISYAELRDRVARLAGALAARGVGKGDRVIVYMPMVPEALVAMLACARLGAIHSVVFGGFAAPELAIRIDDAKPKAILAASCGIEPGRVIPYKPMVDAAIEIATHKPEFCIILQRPQVVADAGRGPRSRLGGGVCRRGARAVHAGRRHGPALHPLHVRHDRRAEGGRAGDRRLPGGARLDDAQRLRHRCRRGVLDRVRCRLGGRAFLHLLRAAAGRRDDDRLRRQAGGHARRGHVLARDFRAPGQVVLHRADGFRAIKREDPTGEFVGKYDLSSLKLLFLAGERADPDTIVWAQDQLKVPVIDHWWQTETGWPIVANPAAIELLPIKLGSPTLPLPGYDVQILGEDGHPLPRGELGAVAIRLPLPPGTLPTLWNADERFVKSYLTTFPGYYETGDAGVLDEDGYLSIMARTDDVINVAGHRLSTGGMEEVLASHPDVAECAVIGIADDLKGQLPMGFLCLNRGCDRDHEEIVRECIKLVRDRIGPVAAFKHAVVVDRLPKTRSGKILRGVMAKIADGKEYKPPATIDDPVILGEIGESLARIGLPARG
jgi:propionyl-CoA synthetase